MNGFGNKIPYNGTDFGNAMCHVGFDKRTGVNIGLQNYDDDDSVEVVMPGLLQGDELDSDSDSDLENADSDDDDVPKLGVRKHEKKQSLLVDILLERRWCS